MRKYFLDDKEISCNYYNMNKVQQIPGETMCIVGKNVQKITCYLDDRDLIIIFPKMSVFDAKEFWQRAMLTCGYLLEPDLYNAEIAKKYEKWIKTSYRKFVYWCHKNNHLEFVERIKQRGYPVTPPKMSDDDFEKKVGELPFDAQFNLLKIAIFEENVHNIELLLNGYDFSDYNEYISVLVSQACSLETVRYLSEKNLLKKIKNNLKAAQYILTNRFLFYHETENGNNVVSSCDNFYNDIEDEWNYK